MKNFLANCGLVVGSLFVALILIELVARQFVGIPAMYPTKPGIMVADARGFWSIEPDFEGEMGNRIDFNDKSIKMEAYGNRTVPCGSNIKERNRRVYLLGDSQTFGWGVSDAETWANQAQCALNLKIENPPKIINFGVPGTQVDEYVSRGIFQVLPAVESGDIIILSITWNDLVSFYVGDKWVANQLADAGLAEIKAKQDGMTTIEETGSPSLALSPRPEVPLAFEPSRPKRILNPPTSRYDFYIKYGILLPNFTSLAGVENYLIHISASFRLIWSHARLLFYRIRPSDSFFQKLDPNSYRQNFLSLKAIARQMESRGAKVLIQFLPNRIFFDDYYYHAYSKNGIVFPTQDYLAYIGQPFCKSLELTCVNRFAALKTSERDAHTFAFDGHYNERAAERVGNALANDILKLLDQSK